MTGILSESITIEPPIPFDDFLATYQLQKRYPFLPPGPLFVISKGDLAFAVDSDHPNGRCATAIIPWGEPAADPAELLDALRQAVTDFARTDDGTVRNFIGYVEREDGDRARTRLYIREGTVVVTKPTWTEPPGEPTGIPADPPVQPAPATATGRHAGQPHRPDTAPGSPHGVTVDEAPAEQAFPDIAANTTDAPEPSSTESAARATEETRSTR